MVTQGVKAAAALSRLDWAKRIAPNHPKAAFVLRATAAVASDAAIFAASADPGVLAPAIWGLAIGFGRPTHRDILKTIALSLMSWGLAGVYLLIKGLWPNKNRAATAGVSMAA